MSVYYFLVVTPDRNLERRRDFEALSMGLRGMFEFRRSNCTLRE